MRSGLQAAAARLGTLLQAYPPAASAALACAAVQAAHRQQRRPAPPTAAPLVTACGVTAAESATAGNVAADNEDLGDLKPGMSLSEEEDDEAEHYSVRAHVHRKRLRPQTEERHLDEEEPPGEEAPGEEAYKEAGPLLPPESEEEDIMTDEEEESRK